MAPSSAMESTRGSCSKAPDGVHHFKYGKCNFCQVPEGQLARGVGVLPNPGGAADCEMGGKCMFKFAKCTKCGRGENGMKLEREESRRSSEVSTASSSGTPRPSPRTNKVRPTSPPLAAAAGLLVKSDTRDEEPPKLSKGETRETPATRKASKEKAGTADDRARVQCHLCGYKSVPQWLNDQAHCLKCDAVVKTLGIRILNRFCYIYIYTWNPKQPFINGCFTWMIANILFHQTSIFKWLFGVPGIYVFFNFNLQLFHFKTVKQCRRDFSIIGPV